MRLILIRHGDPDYELDSLTEKGWREAELLSKRVCRWKVKDFYCSPLGRAKATASCSMEKLGREPEIREWMQEFTAPIIDPSTGKKHGPWDFMPAYWTKEEGLFDRKEWLNTEVMKSGKVRENYEWVCNGLDDLLAEHGYRREGNAYRIEKQNDDTIVIFCHLGVSCVMIGHLLGISPLLLWQGFFLPPTSVSILTTEERDGKTAFFRCQVMGDTTHLHDGGEPISESGYYTTAFQD